MENIPDQEQPILPFFQKLASSKLRRILTFYVILVIVLLFDASQYVSFYEIVFYFFLGVGAWTITEYVVHRFVFHGLFEKTPLRKFQYFMHGYHHFKPTDLTRVTLPLILTIPIFLLSYLLLIVVFGIVAEAYIAGFVVGYLFYDSIHYSVHRFNFRRGLGRFLKSYHFYHHFKANQRCFGVTSPLWDYVFLTTRRKET